MEQNTKKIVLNDILKLDNLHNVKIRFNLMFRNNWNSIEIFKNDSFDILLEGQYWNYKNKKSYKRLTNKAVNMIGNSTTKFKNNAE